MPDVAIVGGGPAGLAVAIEARLRGLTVRVIDRRRPPLDKACGEGLMPDGLERLRAMGVRIGTGDFHPFRGIHYVDGKTRIDGLFPAGHAGAGIRRTVLHDALRRRAEELGAELEWGTRVRSLDAFDAHREARWIVGADGLRSQVRHWIGLERRAGLERASAAGERYGVRRHYQVEPWTDRVEVHWGDGREAYVTPVAPDGIGVAMLWDGGRHRCGFDAHLEAFPALRERLRDAAPVSKDRGAGPFRQRARAVVRGRVALVGDAAGYRDAITGEGLSLAFHQAAALADALAAGDLRPYAREHRRLDRVPGALSELVLFLERHPALRRRAFRALAAEPAIFERFLAVHCRAVSPAALLPVAPRLLGRLATPPAARP